MNNKLNARERAYVAMIKCLPCSVCGQEGPSDAHHTKQGNQYTVVALCQSCHTNNFLGWHGQKRAWAIAKMDENDALNRTIHDLIEYMQNN